MGSHIEKLKAQLFSEIAFVCGGHGARWPSDKKFVVPDGITIYFYVRDSAALKNSIGMKVDQILNGKNPPVPRYKISAGSRCWDYRLFHSSSGRYLDLANSTIANERYLTNPNNDSGIHLSEICTAVLSKAANAAIHWSACRLTERENSHFPLKQKEYRKKLRILASKAGKKTYF